ncbi:unnamed protein product [Nezara viridula]|uniref:Uncharacterized protein n=1 Tax=Nezara viridula TaxID=85310 RepID=A0A9P0MTQ4_NEZVI|nr:unnamed protein product [Nezara viridula]
MSIARSFPAKRYRYLHEKRLQRRAVSLVSLLQRQAPSLGALIKQKCHQDERPSCASQVSQQPDNSEGAATIACPAKAKQGSSVEDTKAGLGAS